MAILPGSFFVEWHVSHTLSCSHYTSWYRAHWLHVSTINSHPPSKTSGQKNVPLPQVLQAKIPLKEWQNSNNSKKGISVTKQSSYFKKKKTFKFVFFFKSLQYNKTFGTPGSVAQYHDQPAPHEVFQPFNRDKLEQKAALQPTVSSARDRVQEQGVMFTGQFITSTISSAKISIYHRVICFTESAIHNLMGWI